MLPDGGMRHGGDVVKALALGTHAVLIGRAFLCGLTANGQGGAENVRDLLLGGICSCLARARALVERRAVTRGPGLSPEDLVIPPSVNRHHSGMVS